MSTIYVHIDKNGEDKVVEFLDNDSIEFVENKMRGTYGVQNGTLSSVQNRTVIVRSFIAGTHYYFRDYDLATNASQDLLDSKLIAVNALVLDQRVGLFCGPRKATSSAGSGRKIEPKFDWSDPYWKKCLFCDHDGTTRQITKAHIIPGNSKVDYRCFGPPTYADHLDVGSQRNFIPLCGTHGDKDSCHHKFDEHLFNLLWNPFEQKYYLHVSTVAVESLTCASSSSAPPPSTTTSRSVEIPRAFHPYKRLLAARALGSIFNQGIYDSNLHQCLFVPLDTGSVGTENTEEDEVEERSAVSSSVNPASVDAPVLGKRKPEEKSFEQKKKERGMRFKLVQSDSSGLVQSDSSWPKDFEEHYSSKVKSNK